MRKSYVKPEAKVFVIGADERIAAVCSGTSYVHDEPQMCNDTFAGDMGEACSWESPFSS